MAKIGTMLRQAGIWIHTRHVLRDEVTNLPQQTAALPWRGKGAKFKMMLVTGRSSGRWTLPKGWPMFGKTLAEAAAQEAYEEAGVEGAVEQQPIGRFNHTKSHAALGKLEVTILVHPLEVRRVMSSWPEKGARERRWVDPGEAADLVDNPQLTRILLDFAAQRSR